MKNFHRFFKFLVNYFKLILQQCEHDIRYQSFHDIECRAYDCNVRDDTEAARTSASLVILSSSFMHSFIHSFIMRTYTAPIQETLGMSTGIICESELLQNKYTERCMIAK